MKCSGVAVTLTIHESLYRQSIAEFVCFACVCLWQCRVTIRVFCPGRGDYELPPVADWLISNLSATGVYAASPHLWMT